MAGLLRARWTPLLLLLLALLSFCLFLYGFFPLKYHTGRVAGWDDLPAWIESVSIDGQEVYNPGETTVVMMVIDALRYDFVTEEFMPFTTQLLKNKSACIYVALAEPPTVTMPRIKAMMTGSVSTFADVALNFGAPAVRGDSVVRAAVARGRRAGMYGDDTWLRLFPGLWAESDGTTSFYVTDYTEVDNNVTRHLDSILTADDKRQPPLDLVVLHYLGLDHIGHLEGARSPKIKPKLLEMDAAVRRIFNAMGSWDRSGALVICGDHGMRDAGGHGGSSPAELLVPLVVARTPDYLCPHEGSGGTVAQVDVAPSLAYLLRSPIPGDSTGRFLPSLLPPFQSDPRQHLYLLHYNAHQNARALRDTLGDEEIQEKELYKQFRRAEGQFAAFLGTGQQSAAKLAQQFYEESLLQMSKCLLDSTVQFDVFAIALAVLLLFMMLLALLVVLLHSLDMYSDTGTLRHGASHRSHSPHSSTAGAVVALLLVAAVASFILLLACAVTETSSAICSLRAHWLGACGAVSLAAAGVFFVIKAGVERAVNTDIFTNMTLIEYLLMAGTVLHSLTFVGTSFIEEEHQTWYMLWNTLMLLVLARTVGALVCYVTMRLEGATELQDKPTLREQMTQLGVDTLPKWILLISLHRFLRTLNQTGDRWLFLPDAADWLNSPDNRLYLQALTILGIVVTLLICLCNLRHTNNILQMNTALTIVAAACVFSYHVSTHTLPAPFAAMTTWDSVHIVNVFWGLLLANILFETFTFLGVYRCWKRERIQDTCRHTDEKNSKFLSSNDNAFLYQKPKEKSEDVVYDMMESNEFDDVKLSLARSLSHVVLNSLMLLELVLMRPHNVVLVPSVYVTCALTARCIRRGAAPPLQPARPRPRGDGGLHHLVQALAHYWIGCVFFFYQGNSNSLASVDLSAGYVGLREYSPVRVSLRIGAHTYAGPALAIAMLFCTLAAQQHTWQQYKVGVWRCASALALARVYTLTVYACVAAGFRHHLFVWSVFSPKLLYELVASVFSVAALATLAAIFVCVKLTHASARWLARPRHS